MSKTVIELQNIRRDFQVGDETVHALRGVSFSITEGEFVTIMGTSGSGKSTLLNTLGCLDTPTSGEYLLDGISVRTMSKPQRAILRNRKIGFVFQNYNLIDYLTPLENVRLVNKQAGKEILLELGLDETQIKRNVLQLSGGQQQRVLLARALINAPRLLLLDEPTSGMDEDSTTLFYRLLYQINREQGVTIWIVTHDRKRLMAYADDIWLLEDEKMKLVQPGREEGEHGNL